jgi:hypothetical protein
MRMVLTAAALTCAMTVQVDGAPRRGHTHHIAGASPVYRLPPQGVLTASDLSSYAGLLLNTPTDQFSGTFDSTPLVGRSFVAAIPVREDGNPKWSYDRDRQTLSLEADEVNIDQDSFLAVSGSVDHDKDWLAQWRYPARALPISIRLLGTQKKVEQNAFGAEVAVDSSVWLDIYLAELMPKSSSDQESVLDSAILFTVHLAPDEARAATQAISMVAAGTVTAPDPGHPIRCGGVYEPPTFDEPIEVARDRCIVTVRLDALSFVGPKGVLAQWKRPGA